MTKYKPYERATIEEIKESKCYNGKIYTPEELKDLMSKYLLA